MFNKFDRVTSTFVGAQPLKLILKEDMLNKSGGYLKYPVGVVKLCEILCCENQSNTLKFIVPCFARSVVCFNSA